MTKVQKWKLALMVHGTTDDDEKSFIYQLECFIWNPSCLCRPYCGLLLLSIFLLFFHSSSNAFEDRQQSWESVPIRTAEQKAAGLAGGEGFQMVHAITYASSDPLVAYLSTDTSQVWKSTDGGFSWQSKNHGFMANGARSIIVDPKNGDIVFAAGFLGAHYEKAHKYKKKLQGIYRTADGSEHWIFVKATDFYKQESKGCLFAFDSSSCRRLRTWTIFAGSYNEGLLCSQDGGDSWRPVGFQGQHIVDMKENPAKPGELLISTEEGLYKYAEGVLQRIGKGLPDWPRSIAVSPKSPKVLYAAVGKKGVYKSVDGGASFQAANSGICFRTDFTDIAVSPVNSDIVYVKAHKSRFRKPSFSHDGARSWHAPKSTNLGSLLPQEKGFWFSSPFAPHPKEALTALTASNGKGRILKTLDGGENWAYSGSGFTGGRMRDIAFSKDGKMVFCLTDHGVWLTEDRGGTFRELKVKRVLGAKSSYSGDIRGNTVIVSVGTWGEKGLAVSHDLGKTWKTFDELINPYRFIAIHPKHDNIIYAGPYRSGDKGNTWTKLSHSVTAMYPRNGDIVYAAAPAGEKECFILKSVDQGATWLTTYPVCPFPVKSVRDVAIAPDDPDRIYVAAWGLWIFDGKKWLLRNADHGLDKDFFGMCYLSCLSVDPNNPNRIYVGRQAPGCGQSNGIFRSLDGGLTWKNITHNLGPELTVWAIEISPLDSTIYIGTSLGTWKYEADKTQRIGAPRELRTK